MINSGLTEKIYHAVRPWMSLDAESGIAILCHDSQEQINKCLCCEYEECINCLGNRKQSTMGRPRVFIDEELFMEMVLQNAPIKQMCDKFQCSPRTISRYKKQLKEEIL